ncbi:MAG: amidohydrolase family protein [Acidobacteria bacterium]|nr:amidohydrolase family protein [Acidobacteriota bacterium]
MWTDSHHHLWRYVPADYPWITPALGVLQRDYGPEELEAALTGAGVDRAVAVQARQDVAETRWLLSLAEGQAKICGVVGWVPLYDAGVETLLDELSSQPRLVGIRHIVHDEPDDNFLLREDFNRGVSLLAGRGLAYDILIFERHLRQALEFVTRHPKQMFVVDHIAKPRIAAGEMEPWRQGVLELARRENVVCKLSGMVTEAAWNSWEEAELRPYFEVVLAAFGPRRLMFGSDWPVILLASSYSRWKSVVEGWLATLTAEERFEIQSGTAARVYRLAE